MFLDILRIVFCFSIHCELRVLYIHVQLRTSASAIAVNLPRVRYFLPASSYKHRTRRNTSVFIIPPIIICQPATSIKPSEWSIRNIAIADGQPNPANSAVAARCAAIAIPPAAPVREPGRRSVARIAVRVSYQVRPRWLHRCRRQPRSHQSLIRRNLR